ncbi:hypothetical protein VSS37_17915 [Candidatus Thiothrix sp. Deng01]|uniref:Uncharacterized protein n=1 Tax=Candidatus Thiothrix phosphatis TaxID=3112415 RepID=A0ABU6D1C1_9GAMM|nr:hypothetical protein [Candidatus Thiothrix sp. Deng01]MEB4592860.1 hypothetical protein [Candidatus Thiothrix sp. Deng01]
MTPISAELQQLQERSVEMEEHLLKLLQASRIIRSDRAASSRIMCGVAFEHAESIRMLITGGNFTSATGLLRLQFEALVRAMWLLHAAPDKVTARLMGEFNQETAKKADRLPMMTEMLNELEGKAPPEDMRLLLKFKDHSWKPLSSYVHGGIHVMHRHSQGYPTALIHQAIKASNYVSLMVSLNLVRLLGNNKLEELIVQIQRDYADCFLPSRTAKAAKRQKTSPENPPSTG